MRKFLILTLMAVWGGFSGWAIMSVDKIRSQQNINIEASPSPKPTVAKPARLIIPKINIDAGVEEVGIEEDGSMGVPSGPDVVGWYNLGPKPGEIGSAVIDGHLDWYEGVAIFYKIKELEVGDEIRVSDEDGQEKRFLVSRIEIYQDADFPIEEVFVSRDVPRLNLITCEGVFDVKSKNYEKRLVVYSEMVS